jgi:hypothetical protein
LLLRVATGGGGGGCLCFTNQQLLLGLENGGELSEFFLFLYFFN